MQEVCLCLRHILVRVGTSLCEACPCKTGCVLDGESVSLSERSVLVGGVFLGLVMSMQEKCPCGKGHVLWKRTFPLGRGLLQYLGKEACPCEIGCVLLGECMSLWEEACICKRLFLWEGTCHFGMGQVLVWGA